MNTFSEFYCWFRARTRNRLTDIVVEKMGVSHVILGRWTDISSDESTDKNNATTENKQKQRLVYPSDAEQNVKNKTKTFALRRVSTVSTYRNILVCVAPQKE